jgi:MFS family permease
MYRTFTCISVVPVANQIALDLGNGSTSKSATVLLVTIWELGEAAGPLLIAPMSEIWGRYPVFNTANILFISATAFAALCQSMSPFIAARALTGLAVASNVLNPAIVGDMFVSEQRGSPMSVIMLAPLLGGGIGPTISGAIADVVGWRQVLWLGVCLATVCELLFLTCFRETYKVPILKRRAMKLRRDTGEQWRTAFDTGESQGRTLVTSILRPGIVLAGSGVLMLLCLFIAVGFSYYYVTAVTLPGILQDIYGLSAALTGASLTFFSMC